MRWEGKRRSECRGGRKASTKRRSCFLLSCHHLLVLYFACNASGGSLAPYSAHSKAESINSLDPPLPSRLVEAERPPEPVSRRYL